MPIFFFDTSALAKLYHREAGSDYVQNIVELAGENRIFISPLALIEMESVFANKVRSREFTVAGLEVARRKLRSDLAKRRMFVSPPFEERHFQYAQTCVGIYGVEDGLRTLDALQLSMAVHLSHARLCDFVVTADQTLCRVARKEGISAIDPQVPPNILPE